MNGGEHSLYISDNIEYLKSIDAPVIDLTVCSPPYDKIRDYDSKDFKIDLPALGRELLRVTVDGGVCVIVINDGTKDFKKSLTSFRMVVDWVDAGWGLFETIIYSRPGKPGAWWSKRFRVDHEYMFVFFKGKRPKFFDKKHLAIPAKHAGKTWGGTQRTTSGELIPIEKTVQANTKCRGTIWSLASSNSERNKTKLKHPATFSDQLASDHIQTWTEPGDLVCDPFAGSGTTGVMAAKLGRRSLLIESDKEYEPIIIKRYAIEAKVIVS